MELHCLHKDLTHLNTSHKRHNYLYFVQGTDLPLITWVTVGWSQGVQFYKKIVSRQVRFTLRDFHSVLEKPKVNPCKDNACSVH